MENQTQKQIEIELTEDQMQKAKSDLEDSEILDNLDEEIEELKKLRIKSIGNSQKKAKLYFKCYYFLKELRDEFTDKNVGNYIKNLEMDVNFERNLEKVEFGEFYIGLNIQDYVYKNEKDINKVIDLFFRLIKE